MARASDDIDALRQAVAAAVAAARTAVANGAAPDDAAATVSSLVAGARGDAVAPPEQLDAIESRALVQIERLVSVHRARARLTEAPSRREAAPAAAPVRRRALRTRPTISGNFDVRRERRDGDLILRWEPASAVTSWEIRFSEREGPRGAYEVRETRTLEPAETSVELPDTDASLQVHILGRARDGRLVRRAVIAALTRDNFDERWQRRPSAS